MRGLAGIGAIVALAAAGCSTYHTREFDLGRTASSFLGASAAKGLTISAEALTRPDRTERFLWFDCTAYGYLPVVVRVRNVANTGFRIDRDNVKCVLRDGTTLPAAPVDEVIRELEYGGAGAILYVPFGLIPGIWSAIHRAACNRDLAADYEEKHLFLDKPALRAGEGDNLVGVVFFRLKDTSKRPDLAEALLEVKVVKERGAEGGDVEELTLRPQVE